MGAGGTFGLHCIGPGVDVELPWGKSIAAAPSESAPSPERCILPNQLPWSRLRHASADQSGLRTNFSAVSSGRCR